METVRAFQSDNICPFCGLLLYSSWIIFYVFVYVAFCIVRHKEINPLDDQWKEDVDQVEREQFVCFNSIIMVHSLDYFWTFLIIFFMYVGFRIVYHKEINPLVDQWEELDMAL